MWQQEQSLRCHDCGLPRDETQDRTRQGSYVAKPVRCFACQAVGQAHTAFTAGPHDPHGIRYSIQPPSQT